MRKLPLFEVSNNQSTITHQTPPEEVLTWFKDNCVDVEIPIGCKVGEKLDDGLYLINDWDAVPDEVCMTLQNCEEYVAGYEGFTWALVTGENDFVCGINKEGNLQEY